MYKLSLLLFITVSFNSFADDNFNCYSTDGELRDSARWAATSLDLFAQNNYEQVVNTVDACFKEFSYDAVVMQKDFNAKKTKFPPSGKVSDREKKKIHANWAVNDVSVALWAKARSLEKLGNLESAGVAYSQCIFLTHGRAWDPKGWFWVPASDCVRRAKNLIE